MCAPEAKCAFASSAFKWEIVLREHPLYGKGLARGHLTLVDELTGEAHILDAARCCAEAPGILGWLVEGAQSFLDEGLKRPPEVADATSEYRSESDSLGAFLDAWCSQGERLLCPGGELYKAFCAYIREEGGNDCAANSFAERMKRRGFRKGTGRRRYTWLGVDLLSERREQLTRKDWHG